MNFTLLSMFVLGVITKSEMENPSLKVNDSLKIVNNFYETPHHLNLENYYEIVEHSNQYSLESICLAYKFHNKFIDEMFSG